MYLCISGRNRYGSYDSRSIGSRRRSSSFRDDCEGDGDARSRTATPSSPSPSKYFLLTSTLKLAVMSNLGFSGKYVESLTSRAPDQREKQTKRSTGSVRVKWMA